MLEDAAGAFDFVRYWSADITPVALGVESPGTSAERRESYSPSRIKLGVNFKRRQNSSISATVSGMVRAVVRIKIS